MSSRMLQGLFSSLSPNKTIPYMTEGSWSAHTLIPFLLDYTGEATVWISSFSICEDSVRILVSDERIRSLYCLLDASILRYKRALYFFLESKAEIKLCANHSKIILVEGQHNRVAVITSANLTVNRRVEGGVIFTDGHYDTIKAMFLERYNLAYVGTN